jgi:hypothetical protein
VSTQNLSIRIPCLPFPRASARVSIECGIGRYITALCVSTAVVALPASTLTLAVRGTPSRRATSACYFLIRAPVVGGGTQRTCLTAVDGFPAPRAVLRSRGWMEFVLRRGTLRVRVRITQRFGADGVRARQTVSGTVVGGTGRYAGARGTISGGGSVVDWARGLGPVDLRYTIRLG